MFDNWDSVGTEGYISPGILSKKSYKNADVWSLLNVLHVIVDDLFVFEDDKDTIETKENFILEGKNSTKSFKHFISNMLKSIFDDSFTHEKLVESLWMRY